MNAFSRSWEITKLSFRVINKDKEMIMFPILAGFFSLIFIILMAFPTIISQLMAATNIPVVGILQYLTIFIIYLGISFIATFFNVCVVYTTKTRFDGGDATFMESIKYAFSKIHLIFMWSLVAATVGLILRLIEKAAERFGMVGQILVKILTSILGMMWAIVTIFVVPGMVYQNLSPFAAIKKSIEVLKKTWGESLIRCFGLGLIQFLFTFIGFILFIPIIIFSFIASPIFGIVMVLVTVMYVVFVSLLFGVANSVFNTALFVYANTGKIPTGFSEEVIRNAFRRK